MKLKFFVNCAILKKLTQLRPVYNYIHEIICISWLLNEKNMDAIKALFFLLKSWPYSSCPLICKAKIMCKKKYVYVFCKGFRSQMCEIRFIRYASLCWNEFSELMIWHPGILTRYPTKNKQNRLSIDFTSVWFLPRYETKILSNSMYEIPQPYTNSIIGHSFHLRIKYLKGQIQQNHIYFLKTVKIVCKS